MEAEKTDLSRIEESFLRLEEMLSCQKKSLEALEDREEEIDDVNFTIKKTKALKAQFIDIFTSKVKED